MREKSDAQGRVRAAKVKEAMEHAWRGYKQYAWGFDELAPRGKKGKQAWGGMGVTLVDSLGARDLISAGVRLAGCTAVFVAVNRPRLCYPPLPSIRPDAIFLVFNPPPPSIELILVGCSRCLVALLLLQDIVSAGLVGLVSG